MARQELCCNLDTLLTEEFDYRRLKEENYSKYAWCTTCGNRRRTQSECLEPCKKKSKDMKLVTLNRYEYENMDYDPSTTEMWYEKRHRVRSSLSEPNDCYPRLRPNLCELPTTYIRNTDNCQPLIMTTSKSNKCLKKIVNDCNGPRVSKDLDKYCQTEQHHDISYNTATYFDRESSQNMISLKEQLDQLRQSTYRNSTSAKMIAESLDAKDKAITEPAKVIKSQSNESLKSLKRTKSKIIWPRVKGRRMPVSIKIRRSASRTVISSRISSEANEAKSDSSESEESEADEEVMTTSTSSGSNPILIKDLGTWPLRNSLFPNIPPYLIFNSFDAEHATRFPIGQKCFKWKMSTITPVVVRKVLRNSGFILLQKLSESNQWIGTWGKHIKSPIFKTLKNYQKLNHFPGTFQLGRKDRLWRNFQRMITAHGHKEFGFLPLTYVLPQELKLLKYNWDTRSPGNEFWIIKPPASARGVGIRIINKWSQLPKKTSLVVQKYITNPYLINGSKFDLRLYVLVTSFHPLRVYLYSEGLVRFASVKYSKNVKDIKEKYMHLTNYSINKLSSNYTANEDAYSAQGHKWTITKLLEHLGNQGVDIKPLWKKLELLVIKTMIACEPPITELCVENMNNRYNCYELFGIDVLLDAKLKPWLLEVNISPSLHSASPLDEHVKGPLVQNLFNLAQFHLPPRLKTVAKCDVNCYESRIYSNNLTHTEMLKQERFTTTESREGYLNCILENLTGDDVRHLALAEDEFTVQDNFKRIFPTASTYKLLEFMEPRYYNRLFDAWETKYEKNREAGIRRLKELCDNRIHLKGFYSSSSIAKDG